MRGEYVDVDGSRLYYFAGGSRESGRTLVFLHGLLTSSHLWQGVVSLLPRAHRVVVLDLAGHGRSDPAPSALAPSEHAGLVSHFLDSLGIARATLVGHGLGAGIAALFATNTPARVDCVALISPLLRLPDRWRALRVLARWRGLARWVPPVVPRALAHRAMLMGYAARRTAQAGHSVDQYLRPFITPVGAVALLAQLSAARPAVAFRSTLPSQVSVGITWGTADSLVSSQEIEQLRSLSGQPSLERVEGGGHFLPEEHPERVVTFLTRLFASSPCAG